MKKNYVTPEIRVNLIQLEKNFALSVRVSTTNPSDVDFGIEDINDDNYWN